MRGFIFPLVPACACGERRDSNTLDTASRQRRWLTLHPSGETRAASCGANRNSNWAHPLAPIVCIMAQAGSSVRLEAPPSDATVRVRLLDTTGVMTIAAESFVKPTIEGHEVINVTDIAFVIEHRSGKKIMFDAGVRKDYWNLPAVIQKRLGDVIRSMRVEQNASEIVRAASIDLKSICQSHCPIVPPSVCRLTLHVVPCHGAGSVVRV